MAALSVSVQDVCFAPLPDHVEDSPVVDALASHGQEPRVVQMVKEAVDGRFHQGAIRAVLESEGEVAARLLRSPSGAIPVPALQKVLRIDGRQQLRTGQLDQFLFEGRNPSRPVLAVAFRQVTASDPCGPVAFRSQARHPCGEVGLEMGLGDRCRPVVVATGGVLLQGVPAVEQQLGVQTPGQIPTAVGLVGLRFVGSAPQGGWLLVLRSNSVRQTGPVRAADFRHVLPLVGGCPHR
jgi:hypothetical protein